MKQPRVTQQAARTASAKPHTVKPQPGNRRLASVPAAISGISCVPYVRSVTGMDISGNAHLWWANAAGSYARGQRPERGSVLSFRASGGMRSGHVAVVSRVVNSREILIDHANWEGPGIRKGTVMRGVSVIDVSDRNDWTLVRVQVGHGGDYGRPYPTNGFIHNRPAGSMRTADNGGFEEVAEAPSPARAHADHMAGALQELNLNAR
ncbi:CHAP domain-containing protein [Roseomonas sp. GC11]|uniref:CHAP domain-containing protein n=1 Tax=Roseomonas sp. GC11 TaxID=2950546 RepID=UPI002108AB95|nr:CHAP domain-containing protein [Roseomonas sp. GC11]